jgi:hypothetical protein
MGNLTIEQAIKAYFILPTEAQKRLKKDIQEQTGWGKDLFYKKINERTPLNKTESTILLSIFQKYERIIKLSHEIDEALFDEFESKIN